MELLPLIRELEGKTRKMRLNIIRQYLNEWEVDHRLEPYASGTNLIVPAKKRPYIGIASHFDTVPNSPGANDNASATVVTLELLRRFKARPTRNVDLAFFFFDEEEVGLKGSTAFVEDHGIYGMIGLLNMEMVGMGDQLALWPLNDDSDSNLLKTLEQQSRKAGIPSHRFDRIVLHYADHEPFRKNGLKENAFTVSVVSEKDLEVAAHYYKALSFEVDQATLWEIFSQAPINSKNNELHQF